MPTSYTDVLRFTQQAIGGNPDTWGNILNLQYELLEAAIAGVASIALADTDYTLNTADGTYDEARNMALAVSGTATAKRTLYIPAVTKMYRVANTTSGGGAIHVTTSAGAGVDVPNGEARMLWCDGINVAYLAKAQNAANADYAASAGNAATVDGNSASAFLPAGGTAVNADKLDNYDSSQAKNGNTVAVRKAAGQIAVTTPASNEDAANKEYVDRGLNTPLGAGQSWQDMTPLRAEGINYTNNTGRSIMVSVSADEGNAVGYFKVDGVIVARLKKEDGSDDTVSSIQVIVPSGAVYSFDSGFWAWAELRS